MAPTSQRQKSRAGVFPELDAAIQDLNLARDTCGVPPAQVAFGSTSDLLVSTGDSIADKRDYLDLGLYCADICKVLDRRLDGRRSDELSQPVLEAIEQLTTTVAAVQKKIATQGKRSAVSQVFHAKSDKDTIAVWRQDLVRVHHVFNTELAINTHAMVADIRRSVLESDEGTCSRRQSVQAGPVSPNAGGHISPPQGVLQREFPPPPPGACFGRDILIEEIVGLAENLKPIALIGGGGIGKTSVALTVLHHDQVKDLFGNNRGFIRCDQFPASRAHFLARLSKVIGAGVESPETLIALRPFLSSHRIFIILDNAESILDPQGTNAQEIYAVVDELCRFKTICLLITSRITTVPRHCKRPVIPALSLEAASNIFYNIYDNRGRSDIVNNLLQRLDFHALSIALLATTASYNMWDYDRMAKEWDAQRAQVLRTDSNESLAATIELSLASPTFRQLGPKARDTLRVVAFFPQGVDEKNFDRLFPTISSGTGVLSRLSPTTSDRKNILDKFCVLSLTHRCNGFITMLAPIRDYLCPKDLKSSPLLRATKDRYFTRLSATVHPSRPGFREAEWIRSEDVNVEHLLDVFTSFESGKPAVWKACIHFMEHLYWHKPRQTVLKNKIEGLPDNHPLKPRCLTGLSLLSQSLGNFAEQKRLLSQVIQLERRRRDDDQVARALKRSSDANRMLGLHEEGTQQIREALEIYERVGNITEQAESLEILAWLLYDDKKYAAAEGAVARAIYLFPQRGREFQVCQSHHLLGNIYRNKGEREKAIRHFEVAINIASPFNWQIQLFWPHYSLALLFHDEGSFDDARVHVERAKLYVGGRERLLGRAMELQGRIWHQQGRLEDARSEVFRANEIFERLGAFDSHVEKCRDLFQEIEREIELKNQPTSDKPDSGSYGTLYTTQDFDEYSSRR